jgi:hypothetical protein
MGCINQCAPSLQSLASLFAVSSDHWKLDNRTEIYSQDAASSETYALIQDAASFVRRSGLIIAQSAPHI